MNRFLYIFLFFNLIGFAAHATHERAGEITYRHIVGLTYEVTLVTYTYAPSPADRPELEISWGDGTSDIVQRTYMHDLTPVIRRNEYQTTHTFPGASTFTISVEDPNRNYGVINIPNSVNVPFYVETELVINQFLGPNNSVILLNPPLDYGCVDKLYVHNPAAYDPDGDSISYKLTVCRGSGGLPIPGFTLPQASISFSIDPLSGDLIWEDPVLQGEYNVAFIIEEWRFGQRIGYVTRDMQILIDACDNNPPVITTLNDTCVEAGDQLVFAVTAVDPDGDDVTLGASGSPFQEQISPAELLPSNPITGSGEIEAEFSWSTNCSHVSKNPHPTYFKAKDDGFPVALTAYKTVYITVVAPAPENLFAIPLGNAITLNWDESICENAIGYYIYRRSSSYGFEHGVCETGVPAYTGFSLISEINNINEISFVDDNDGIGLSHGIEYCYMVTAYFPDGAESYASAEACAFLKKDLPIITNVSVNNTDSDNGSIFIAWSKPTELDFTQTPGPFQYQLMRSDNEQGGEFELIQTYDLLDDTIYIDTFLNTLNLQYEYKVDFYNNSPGDFFLIGSTLIAPSIYLDISPTDKALLLDWNNDVPWLIDSVVVYRQDPLSIKFDSIGWTFESNYLDTGLVNGEQYCYYLKTIGKYSAPGMVDPIINLSQENCGIPVDNVPPCAPILSVSTNCDLLHNELTWLYPDTCVVEELIYYIYFGESEETDFNLIDSTYSTSYIFESDPPSIVGCFTVTALDSLRNQSLFSNLECVDITECGRMWFPIVFTPNDDGYNDVYRADSVNSINSLEIKIFNRWGDIVFEDSDPFFRWDGKDQKTNKLCSPGVYFFEALVSEYTLRGPVERKVVGSITLLK